MKVTTAADWSTINVEMTVEEHGQFIMALGYAAGSIRPGDDDIRRMIFSIVSAFIDASRKFVDASKEAK